MKFSQEEIKALKEKRKQETKKEIEKAGIKIGRVTVKNNHPKDCGCLDCLTLPEPFYLDEHQECVDLLFEAVNPREGGV